MNKIKLIFTITLSSIISAAEMKMNEMTKEEAYTILSQASGLTINSSSTEKDIQKAYRKSLLKWHPDKNLDQEEKATTNTKWVNHAYKVLTGEIQPAPSSSSSSSTPQQPPQERKEDPEMTRVYVQHRLDQALECTLGIENQLIALNQLKKDLLNAKNLAPAVSLFFFNIAHAISFYESLYKFFSVFDPASSSYEPLHIENFYKALDDFKEDKYVEKYISHHLESSLCCPSGNEMQNIKIGIADLKAKSEYYLGKYYLEKNKVKKACKYLRKAREYFINIKWPDGQERLPILECSDIFFDRFRINISQTIVEIENKLEIYRQQSCVIQ